MNFILLAAGHGQRMGGNKALVDFQGKPWILKQLQQIQLAGFKKVILVTNTDSKSSLEKILREDTLQVRVVTNPTPEKGPFFSLQLALSEASQEASFVCPVDVPLKHTSIIQLSQEWQKSTIEALIPAYKEHRGHPVMISAEMRKYILTLSAAHPHSRLDFVLKALPEDKKKVLAVEDPYITLNLNSPEDFASL